MGETLISSTKGSSRKGRNPGKSRVGVHGPHSSSPCSLTPNCLASVVNSPGTVPDTRGHSLARGEICGLWLKVSDVRDFPR